jgi:hypothetical protein
MKWGHLSGKTLISLAIVAAAAFAPRAASADEIKLKDGTKITGTIVGFEENSFKVKTSYGFAEVQKDQVVSIEIAEPAKKPDAKEKSAADPSAEKTAPAAASKSDDSPSSESGACKPAENLPSSSASAKSTASKKESSLVAAQPGASQPAPVVASSKSAASSPKSPASVAGSATATNSASAGNAADKGPVTAVDKSPASAATRVPANAASSSAPSNGFPAAEPEVAQEPPKSAAPEPIREEVTGNTYTNDTYGFHMYKPPDWQVIPGARAMLPGAITAMGTDDQRTYLLIGQEPVGKSLATDAEAAESRLREIMDNFRSLGETQLTVSGGPAVMHRFRGTVDQHDWSGVAVFVPRGAQLYTIFGMTLADNDLVQIQEAVIKRAISSLQFTHN